VFFFEKKNQKTFAPPLSSPDAYFVSLRGTKRTKVFGSFFQKRTLLLPAVAQTAKESLARPAGHLQHVMPASTSLRYAQIYILW
jgi:hypothetical protein